MPVAHIDLDAFFAACEHRRNPDLPDATVICIYTDEAADRGVVSTASYAARDHGIQAGMPIKTAKQRTAAADEEVQFLSADKPYYRTVSRQVMDILRDHADAVETASIDEAYVTPPVDGYDAAADWAERLRTRITDATGVTASVGIGPNKLIAKMASDVDKPDGYTVVPPDAVEEFLAGRPVTALHGVGDQTADALQAMDVETVDDLRSVPAQRLIDRFGDQRGTALYRKARGEGEDAVEPREPQQHSRITTVSEPATTMADLRPVLRELADDVCETVTDRGVQFKRVTALCITPDRETRTRSETLQAHTDDRDLLVETVETLVKGYLQDVDEPVKRVGVRVAALSDARQKRLSSF